MKKLIVLATVAAAGYFATGFLTFSEANVAKFLINIDDQLMHGDANGPCEKMGDKINFSMTDASANPPESAAGGKSEICGIFAASALMYRTAPITDNIQKSDFTIKRDYLKWNTATVSFTERHTIELRPMRTTLKTISQQQVILEKKGNSFIVSKWHIDTRPE